MKLNSRHGAGLFLTLVAVGCGLFLECSAKQAIGIALLGTAFYAAHAPPNGCILDG